MNILVVDDSSTMRRVIANALKANFDDVNVIEANDGITGLEQFKKHMDDLDLVLSDWLMPNRNGYELLEDIMAITKKVPVVMLTTEAENDRIMKAIKLGAKNYITKPFTPQVLHGIICSVLNIT